MNKQLIILLLCVMIPSSATAAIDVTIVSSTTELTPGQCESEYVTLNYGISHTNPLNHSTIAYLFAANITEDNSYNCYIRTPPNDIAFDGLWRNMNRNVTPYLNWEFNDTITEGNVWKWGGIDNNSQYMTINNINATYTFVNVSMVAYLVYPSMHYISMGKMFASEKDSFEISRAQTIITKMYDPEIFSGRNYVYTICMHFDSVLTAINPTDVISIYAANQSFDPLTDDYTNHYGAWKMAEWSYDRWTSHTINPDSNSSYAEHLCQATDTVPGGWIPSPSNYIIFASDTQSSKPFLLNATNDDPNICNTTFADTETMWLRNEVTDVTIPLSYTPACFYTFAQDNSYLESKFYVADNTNDWGYNGINQIPVGTMSFKPHANIFEYFNISGIKDYNMTGNYVNNIYIGITYLADPDGGNCNHEFVLCYEDGTEIETFNDSIVTCCAGSFEIRLNYSDFISNYNYKIKSVVTDDELDIAISYSPIFTIGYIEPENKIVIYYAQDNMTTEFKYGDKFGYHTDINDTLDLYDVRVVTIQNKIISDNIVDNPHLIFQYKYIALFVYLFVIIAIIIMFTFIAKRLWF